jgi:hypothetical protein
MKNLTTAYAEDVNGKEEQSAKPRTQSQQAEQGLKNVVPDYALLYFDHLYSEYLALNISVKSEELKTTLESIYKNRLECKLTWSEIYTFDLKLLEFRSPENLVRKAYDARGRYRNIAGQKEYDEYLASKPPDLASIQIAPDKEPPEPSVIIRRALRADIEYLLSRFYLYYAMLPVREKLRDRLTIRAVFATAIVVVAIGFAIALNVGASPLLGSFKALDEYKPALNAFDQYTVVLVTVLSVTLAGIVGGCVSMLQRIQSAPSEGDALFNLAALSNGWRGIILSPLYGGIFASILFVLFSAGILKGSVFPTISTPQASLAPLATQTAVSNQTSTPNVAQAAGPVKTSDATSSAGSLTTAGPADSEVRPTPSSTPASISQPASEPGVLKITKFLKETGPADGVSYALLIVWSFLAGFAERLVPDTLNRLVAKNEAIQGTSK